MGSNKGKIAWLVIGGIVIMGILGTTLNTRLTPEPKGGGIFGTISKVDGVNETEVTAGGTAKIAIIKVDGVMVDSLGSDASSLFSSSTGASAVQIVKQIDKAEKDPNVKAIILQINSPGGTAVAGQTVTERLGQFKNSGKKYYVAMREVAASAAYEISTPADKIFANAETETGSIGVIMQMSNYQGLYDKIGVKDVVIKSGPKKDIGSATRPMTDEERNILQEMVDESYNNFVATVAKWRELDEAKVRALADGRVYTARQAKDFGLIDEIGNMPAVIAEASRGTGVSNPTVVEYGPGALGGIFGSIFQKIAQANDLTNLLSGGDKTFSATNQLMHIWMPQ